jgi:hypothetical protein
MHRANDDGVAGWLVMVIREWVEQRLAGRRLNAFVRRPEYLGLMKEARHGSLRKRLDDASTGMTAHGTRPEPSSWGDARLPDSRSLARQWLAAYGLAGSPGMVEHVLHNDDRHPPCEALLVTSLIWTTDPWTGPHGVSGSIPARDDVYTCVSGSLSLTSDPVRRAAVARSMEHLDWYQRLAGARVRRTDGRRSSLPRCRERDELDADIDRYLRGEITKHRLEALAIDRHKKPDGSPLTDPEMTRVRDQVRKRIAAHENGGK